MLMVLGPITVDLAQTNRKEVRTAFFDETGGVFPPDYIYNKRMVVCT
jgi:hypothetical protein